MYDRLLKRIPLALLLALLSVPLAQAASDEEKGLEIARAADAYDKGFGDFQADMVMTLKNRRGDETRRYIRIRTLEMPDDGDRSLSIFDEPADVKGTAMLTWSHGLKPDDQWLYLPALKRVKRINSRNKSGPFMGSEFAFEDLGSQEVEKYRYRFLREEPCSDSQCYVVERKPAYKYSGYTRQVAWIDKDGYRLRKVDFYDRKNELLKTLTVSGYRQYLDHYWRPDIMEMVNHQNGKSTRLEWKNYRFRTGLGEKDFRSQALKRAR